MTKYKTQRIIYIVAVIIMICLTTAFLNPKTAHAKSMQPFKTLAIGNINIKPLTRRIDLYKNPDGSTEINLRKLGTFKKGDIFRLRTRKGLRTQVYLRYTTEKGDSACVVVKQKKIPMPCDMEHLDSINIIIRKGNTSADIWIYYQDYDEEDEEDC